MIEPLMMENDYHTDYAKPCFEYDTGEGKISPKLLNFKQKQHGITNAAQTLTVTCPNAKKSIRNVVIWLRYQK